MTLLTTYSARSQAIDLKPDNPIGGRYLEPEELKIIRDFKISCDIDRKNLASTESALNDCMNAGDGVKWYHNTKVVVGGMVVSFGIGLLAGYIINGHK